MKLGACHRPKQRSWPWLLPALLMLTACIRQDMSSYLVDGDKDYSVSVMREAYLWDDQWQLKLVTTRMPDCMRRHDLQPAAQRRFRLDLYQPTAGVFILQQGAHWYVTDMQQCRLQQFDEPPPVPGQLLGSFLERQGVLTFVAVAADEAAAAGQSADAAAR